MLRLSIVKNLNFLSKTLPLRLDQSILVNSFAKHLNHPSNFHGYRHISLTTARLCDTNEQKVDGDGDAANEDGGYDITKHLLYKKFAGTPRDRTKIIPYETSVEYIKSAAFKSTYGDKKVWELYRRVHKGQLPKRKTRRSCISHGVIAFGSPCPVCRDEYLVLDYRNLELLKMFISEYTGEILSYEKTGLCQRQHTRLMVNVERAHDLGLLEYQVPFREFDYADYFDVYKKPVFHPKENQTHRKP